MTLSKRNTMFHDNLHEIITNHPDQFTNKALRGTPAQEFQGKLNELIPNSEFLDSLKTKYVFILLTEGVRRAQALRVRIDSVDRMFNYAELLAEELIESDPIHDVMSGGKRPKPESLDQTKKQSLLSRVTEYCESMEDLDQPTLAKNVLEIFSGEIDRNTANVYVHLSLKKLNRHIPKKNRKNVQ